MKILIIGGTGNISRWFTAELAAKGCEITLYNRGKKDLLFPGNVRTVYGDRTDHDAFEVQMTKLGMFDCVIDMVGYEPEDAASAIRNFSSRTAQYIFCSTVDVYSKQQPSFPVPLDQPHGASPSFPYAYKKMKMEELLWRACADHQFPLTVIRPGATYSEGWSPLVTPFGGQPYHLDRLKNNRPVILHGDGSSIWTCSHSVDVAHAFTNAVGNRDVVGKSFNVTGDERMTWRSMHETVAELMGAPPPRFVFIPTLELSRLAPDETTWCVENFQYNNIFDNQAAKEALGHLYRIDFRQGAKRCLDHLAADAGSAKEDSPAFYDALVETWSRITKNQTIHKASIDSPAMKKRLFLIAFSLFLGFARSSPVFAQGQGLSVADFGAVPDGRTDNTVFFQRAIDSVAEKGGRVLIPAGRWLIGGSVQIKPGVVLAGTDASVLSPYQLTGTVILATGGRDREDAAPLFELWNAATATGFTVFYPEQQTKDIHPYPWTFYIRNPAVIHSSTERRKEDFDATIENITLINSYNGIRCGPDENGRHRIFNVAGCVLRRGIMVDWCGDVGRIENVHFHSHYWFHPSTNGNWDDVFQYMQQHLEAFIFGRTDWEYVTNTFVFPAKIGYRFIHTPMGDCNGQFSGIGADATETAVLVESIQSQGLQITNGEFNSHKVGRSTQVIVEKGCAGSIRFTNCGFWGPAEHNALLKGDADVSFQNCYFSSNYISTDTVHPNYSIVAEHGKLQVEDCNFDGAQTDEIAQWNYAGQKKMPACIWIGKEVRYAIVTGNIGYEGVRIRNDAGKKAILRDNEPYHVN